MQLCCVLLWLHATCFIILLDLNYVLSRQSTMLTDVYYTDKGRVQGLRQQVHKRDVDVFYGIPFAEPPVGDGRFRLPVPKDPWKHVWNATVKPNACMQGYDVAFKNFSGAMIWNPNTKPSEDCLYLNVWTPVTSTKNKSVMIWIYGGGFYSGSAVLDVYDAKYMAAFNDIVVVSMQYRVGSLGFLGMLHVDAPGNAGMYDQVAAFQWVQRNIEKFRGSPRHVTIFGESAGAVSVGMHLISPISRGLFHRAILQSGAPHTAWATVDQRESLRRGMVLAEGMGCDSYNVKEIIKCLKGKPADTFPHQDFNPEVATGIMQFPFVPLVDGHFLTEKPEVSLMKGNFKKTQLLVGSNENEGNYFLLYYQPKVFTFTNKCFLSHERFNLTMDSLFTYFPQFPQLINTFGKEAIIFHYTHWKDTSDQEMNRLMIDQSIGDFHFTCPVVDFAERYAAADQDVYYYYFQHRSSKHYWPQWTGVMHGDEINFVFGEPLDSTKGYTHLEKKLSIKIMEYWTNFAKTGDPNKAPGQLKLHEWPKYTMNGKKFLRLKEKYIAEPDKSKAHGSGYRVQACAFWRYYLPKLIESTGYLEQELNVKSGVRLRAGKFYHTLAVSFTIVILIFNIF